MQSRVFEKHAVPVPTEAQEKKIKENIRMPGTKAQKLKKPRSYPEKGSRQKRKRLLK